MASRVEFVADAFSVVLLSSLEIEALVAILPVLVVSRMLSLSVIVEFSLVLLLFLLLLSMFLDDEVAWVLFLFPSFFVSTLLLSANVLDGSVDGKKQ